MKPGIIQGNLFSDHRGSLKYNNDFNAAQVKRMYIIENASPELKRGWKGHKIEQRWFIALTGSFNIKVVPINNFDSPEKIVHFYDFDLLSHKMNVLHVPPGHATLIQATRKSSRLLSMGDYLLGETNDEYRYPPEYFKSKK